jgi:hypothetical protein
MDPTTGLDKSVTYKDPLELPGLTDASRRLIETLPVKFDADDKVAMEVYPMFDDENNCLLYVYQGKTNNLYHIQYMRKCAVIF